MCGEGRGARQPVPVSSETIAGRVESSRVESSQVKSSSSVPDSRLYSIKEHHWIPGKMLVGGKYSSYLLGRQLMQEIKIPDYVPYSRRERKKKKEKIFSRTRRDAGRPDACNNGKLKEKKTTQVVVRCSVSR